MRRLVQILLPLGILALGVGVSAWLIANKKQVQPEATEKFKPSVQVQAVRLENYKPIIISQGTARPRTTIGLSPEVSGRVISISPKLISGGLFNTDDELFRLDARDYELAEQQALADIKSARAMATNALAQVSRAAALKAQAETRITREEAEAKAARAEWVLLGKRGAPPELLVRGPQIKEAKASLYSANAQANAATAQLHSADASLKAAEASLELASLNVERCVIHAPFRGRVQSQMIGVGQIVSRASVLARLQPVDLAEVRLALPLNEFKFLELSDAFRGGKNLADGPRVRLRPSHQGAAIWQGRIVRSVGEVDSGTRMMAVVAQVVDPYQQSSDASGPVLSFGMFVRAEIDGREMKNVAVLPRDVLRGENRVHIHKAGKLHARKVTVAWSTRELVIITGGLRGGDEVSLTMVEAFVEGMSVTVKEAEGE